MDVYQLEITVLQADGLAPKDRNFFGIKCNSDPYVEVKLLPKGDETKMHEKLLVGKTVPIMKTLSPVWDDPLTFTVELAQNYFNEAAMFELTLMDYDAFSEDDLMGVVPVHIPIMHRNLHNVPPSPYSLTKWYGVPASSAEGEEATGRVQCTMNIRVAKATETTSSSGQQQDNEGPVQQRLMPRSLKSRTPQKPPDTVRVEFLDLELDVIRGMGLAAKDSFIGIKTSSDPYCEVRLLPEGSAGSKKIYIGKTNTQMHTLKPKWNASFAYSLPKKDFRPSAIFEVTIMDYDEKTEDDLMGVVPVHIPIGKSGSTTSWYAVPHSSAHGEKATGQLECTLSVTRVIQEVPKEDLSKPKAEAPPPKKALNNAKSSSRAPRHRGPVVSSDDEEDEPTPQQSTSKYGKALSTAKINPGIRHQASQVAVTELTPDLQKDRNAEKRAEVLKNLAAMNANSNHNKTPAEKPLAAKGQSLSGLSIWADIGAEKTSSEFSTGGSHHSKKDSPKGHHRRSKDDGKSGSRSRSGDHGGGEKRSSSSKKEHGEGIPKGSSSSKGRKNGSSKEGTRSKGSSSSRKTSSQ